MSDSIEFDTDNTDWAGDLVSQSLTPGLLKVNFKFGSSWENASSELQDQCWLLFWRQSSSCGSSQLLECRHLLLRMYVSMITLQIVQFRWPVATEILSTRSFDCKNPHFWSSSFSSVWLSQSELSLSLSPLNCHFNSFSINLTDSPDCLE